MARSTYDQEQAVALSTLQQLREERATRPARERSAIADALRREIHVGDIAQALGCSRETVRLTRVAEGIPPKPRKQRQRSTQ